MELEKIKIRMDRSGRILIPKSIRNRLKVSAGTKFEVKEEEGAIRLKLVFKEAKSRRE